MSSARLQGIVFMYLYTSKGHSENEIRIQFYLQYYQNNKVLRDKFNKEKARLIH